EHTHSCNWQDRGQAPPGALLDSCYTPEGTCYAGPTGILPPDKGTIMSYCHLVGGINGIRLEFHQECKTVMRQDAEGSCLLAATIQPPRDLVATSIGGAARLDWLPSPTAGVIRYDVYRSTFPFDPNPAQLGSTTGTVFTDPASGNYVYKVRAARSADSSAFSGEARPAPCLPATPLIYPAGNDVHGIAVGSFDGDGIQDLVVSNGSAHTVSLLYGQRCALCTSPFSPPAAYATAGFAGALATADFDEDGALDVAVA